MPDNQKSHLDDIVDRFVLSSQRVDDKPSQAQEAESESSNRVNTVLVLATILAIVVAAVVGLLLIRA